MSPLASQLVVSVAALLAACVGWFVRAERSRLELADVYVASSGLLVARFVAHGWWHTLLISLLILSMHVHFWRWRSAPNRSPRAALYEAFASAAFFVGCSTQSSFELEVAFPVTYAVAGVALWSAGRGPRAVGLVALIAAGCIQLSRVPRILSTDAPVPHFTATND